MVETHYQIEKHIETTRRQLGSHLQELESKVKLEADWRTHFNRNPMVLMGVAFGGGVLLATMTGTPNRSTRPGRHQSNHASQPSGGAHHEGHLADAWGALKGALIGLTGAKVRNLLNEALPGFNEQYDKMARGTRTSR